MQAAHEIILTAGVLCLAATVAGLLSARLGTPLLLVFIAVGMIAGEDGPGGIQFDDFRAAYLVGSLALAAILFQGGVSTERAMVRLALWPSVLLATLGVVVSAGIVGAAARYLFHFSWAEGLLLGSATAPTDAAAVSVLLRLSRAAVPARVTAALEVESGLNDPMSVFLTVALIALLTSPHGLSVAAAGLLLAREMLGGCVIGLGAGAVLLWLFRRLGPERPVFPVLAVGGALAIFGGAQMVEASGFLAVYLAGLIVGNTAHDGREPVVRFFNTLGWLAQIALFLMLGLLVNPHELPAVLLPALLVAAVLVFVARPVGVVMSLAGFRWPVREIAFVSWVGLRGAVPIFLTIIALLGGVHGARLMFNVVFVVVIVSVAVQGWTIAPVARGLGLRGGDRA